MQTDTITTISLVLALWLNRRAVRTNWVKASVSTRVYCLWLSLRRLLAWPCLGCRRRASSCSIC